MLACPNLAVPPEVMQHIVHVESSANPYAIGVVGGQLERQPKNLAEALATVRMLDARGYNFSVGLAQVNRANLGRYGLDSYPKAFDACANLSAGAHILADCHASAHGDWGKAFSCYYSGNFTTGFRDGYVQKVYASIEREADTSGKAAATPLPATEAIALRPQPAEAKTAKTPLRTTELETVIVRTPGSTNYRVALRSMAIDATAAATVPAIAAAVGSTAPTPAATSRATASPGSTMASTSRAPLASTSTIDDAVFVPEVHGPNDPIDVSTSAEPAQAMNQVTSANTGAVRAGPRQESRDAAFVF